MYDYNAIIWLVVSCVIVRIQYWTIDFFISPFSKKYRLLPLTRQMYIQKNLVKSIILACLVFIALVWVVTPIINDGYWDNFLIHRLAAVYVSNDIIGLICVDNLPKTTRLHHMITSTLVVVSFGLDFNTSDIAQAMLVYTLASATAYMVNFHLAVRWLCAKHGLKKLRYAAAVIYLTCCALSWTWHGYWLWSTANLNIYHACYIFLLGWIVWDDIILMRWLTT